MLVTLNAPLDFADPATGRSYRLFQTGMPGPFAANEVPGATRPVYASYLTLNYDPGRGLQYAGCLLAVVGIFLRYYVRPAAARRPRQPGRGVPSVILLLAAAGVGACAVPASARGLSQFSSDENGTVPFSQAQLSSAWPLGQAENATVPRGASVAPLDCSTWQRLPVLDSGRIMPLDTFARNQVKKICGTPPPGLSAAELLLAWLAEPQAWEPTAFLEAGDELLRSRLLEVPLRDESGRRLYYVSPQQVAAAGKFHERLDQLARQQDEAQRLGWPWEPAARDKKVQQLGDAYNLYRQLTYDPAQPDVDRPWFSEALIATARAWIATEGEVRQSPFGKRPEIAKLVSRASDDMRNWWPR